MGTRLTSLNRVLLALAVAVLASCTSSSEPDIGTLKVSVTTDGTNRDPDGYTIRIDDQSGQPIAINGDVTINELLPAQYTVHLLGTAPNCFVTGTNPLTVAVKAGEQAVAAFTVSCATGGSAVRVTTQLIGTDGDANGYLLKIGSGTPQRIMPQSVVNLGTLEEGRLGLELTDVAAHCTPDPANPTWVNVVAGQPNPVTIKVTCANITGAIQVAVVSSGADVQRNGFGVTIDDVRVSLDSTNTGLVRKLVAGSHVVALDLNTLQANCHLAGENPRAATVVVADTAEVTLAVTCDRMARVRVTVTTSGPDLDADGYRVTLSDLDWYYGTGQAYEMGVPANGTADSPPVLPGSYSITVSGLAANCRQSFLYPNPVLVAALDVQLTIAIQCVAARQIAYVVGVGNATEIALGSESGVSVQLTSNTVADSNPAWSPDGRRLAFASARDGNSEIYTMNADGSDVRRLTTNLTPDYQPTWSPDGNRIAFVSQRDGNPEIYAMNADGSSPVRLTTYTGYDAEPAWSPAGNRILFVSARSQFSPTVHVMNTDGSGVLRLTGGSGEEASPAWSSTGGQIAFMRNSSSGFYLYFMLADGTQVRLVNVSTFGSTSVSWHPNGQIAMTHSWCDYYYGCYSSLAIVEPPWIGGFILAVVGVVGAGMASMRRAALVLGVVLTACSEGEAPTPTPDPPAFAAAGATVPAGNVISASVQLSVTGADSVAVRYRIIDSAPATDLTSLVVPAAAAGQAIMLYGLYPGQSYTATVVAYGAGGVVLSDPLAFTTGALPPDVPVYSTTGTGAEPGYTVFNAGNYGIVIDNVGRIVWYRFFPDGIGLNFQALGNGRYATQPHTVDPTDVEPWVEVAPSGEVTRSFGCARGLQPRFHDAIDDLAGGHWLMCDEVRMMDLSAMGGQATARVTGTVIQHVDASGAALFEWSSFDHFAITDLPLTDRSGPNVNWTHGNAIALDGDGNILASFRSLNEITKISSTTGTVIWRLGGLANQFNISGGTNPPFAGQHGLRPTSAGLLLLDNRGEPGNSRAERYHLDEVALTATLIEARSSSPGAVGMLGGSVQQLGHGHVLVSLGNGQKVEEYDGAGNVVWHLSGGTGYIFRAQRIASLYTPGLGTPR